MRAYYSNMVPADLFTYRLKVVLLTSAGVAVTGQTGATMNIWRAGRGETGPLVDIGSLITVVEVDAVNAPGLYELELRASDVVESFRGSFALYIRQDGGPVFEDLAIMFLLQPATSFGGAP